MHEPSPERTVAEAANDWYTMPHEASSVAAGRALAWLDDIEARILATTITLNCCNRDKLLDKARNYVTTHVIGDSDDGVDQMREGLERMLRELHDHPGARPV